jgi:hypothetical protein
MTNCDIANLAPKIDDHCRQMAWRKSVVASGAPA